MIDRRSTILASRLGLVSLLLLAVLAGCSVRYVTPGRGADFAAFGLTDDMQRNLTDVRVQAMLDREPAANFPVTLAVARVQEAGYRSHSTRGYGRGAYSVVTQRELETDADLQAIASLPRVAGVVTMNRLMIPAELKSDRELRAAAATARADMLLLYTIDTVFSYDEAMRPLNVLTLGLFPTKDVRVHTTASAILIDTRNAYLYGSAEASTDQTKLANAWTSRDAAEKIRRSTERAAFESLLSDFQRAWGEIVAAYDVPRCAAEAN